jgi:hypothetical protein
MIMVTQIRTNSGGMSGKEHNWNYFRFSFGRVGEDLIAFGKFQGDLEGWGSFEWQFEAKIW